MKKRMNQWMRLWNCKHKYRHQHKLLRQMLEINEEESRFRSCSKINPAFAEQYAYYQELMDQYYQILQEMFPK